MDQIVAIHKATSQKLEAGNRLATSKRLESQTILFLQVVKIAVNSSLSIGDRQFPGAYIFYPFSLGSRRAAVCNNAQTFYFRIVAREFWVYVSEVKLDLPFNQLRNISVLHFNVEHRGHGAS